ncbi:MAG: hypothetical protein ACK5WS_03055 [Alphaproteobacteria bacterium]|nr:hypothetical protein [Candidatus Jidaibacter sp.]
MQEEVQHEQNVINDKRAVLASKNEKSLSIHEKELSKLNNAELITKETVASTIKISATFTAKVDNLHQLQEV